MKQTLSLLLCLLLMLGLIPCAHAEDVFTIPSAADASLSANSSSYIESSLTTDRSYLRVNCRLEEEAPVLLSISSERGVPVYQRDYGVCSGNFRSEDIFLRLDGALSIYEVELSAGENVYAFPIYRVPPRVSGAAACAAGYPLSSLSGLNTWQTVTLLDLSDLEGSSMTVPLYVSNGSVLGDATFSVRGGQLTVSADLLPGLDGSIDQGKIHVATTALEAQSLGRKNFSGVKGKLNSAISLNGAAYAAVYVQLTVSYAPAEMEDLSGGELYGQDDLWQHMLNETVNEAVG